MLRSHKASPSKPLPEWPVGHYWGTVWLQMVMKISVLSDTAAKLMENNFLSLSLFMVLSIIKFRASYTLG